MTESIAWKPKDAEVAKSNEWIVCLSPENQASPRPGSGLSGLTIETVSVGYHSMSPAGHVGTALD